MKPIIEKKSYLKRGAIVAVLLFAGFAALILTACGGGGQRRAYNAAIARDTLHHSMRGVQKMISDSVRIEFCRLAVSAPRTFKDVVTLRDRTSAYKDDQELRCAGV